MTEARTLKNNGNEAIGESNWWIELFFLFFAESTKCGCSTAAFHFFSISLFLMGEWKKWRAAESLAAQRNSPAIKREWNSSFVVLLFLRRMRVKWGWWIHFGWVMSGACSAATSPKGRRAAPWSPTFSLFSICWRNEANWEKRRERAQHHSTKKERRAAQRNFLLCGLWGGAHLRQPTSLHNQFIDCCVACLLLHQSSIKKRRASRWAVFDCWWNWLKEVKKS